MPRHDDEGICFRCGKPVRFWDVNPMHIGSHWLHTGRTYEEGMGGDPRYCNENKAAVI